jgi:hypothetical protein
MPRAVCVCPSSDSEDSGDEAVVQHTTRGQVRGGGSAGATALAPTATLDAHTTSATRCNINIFDNQWVTVLDLLFEEYAVIEPREKVQQWTVDLVNNTPDVKIIEYQVHNAQVRATCKAFQMNFVNKAKEVIRRKEPSAMFIYGRFIPGA